MKGFDKVHIFFVSALVVIVSIGGYVVINAESVYKTDCETSETWRIEHVYLTLCDIRDQNEILIEQNKVLIELEKERNELLKKMLPESISDPDKPEGES